MREEKPAVLMSFKVFRILLGVVVSKFGSEEFTGGF